MVWTAHTRWSLDLSRLNKSLRFDSKTCDLCALVPQGDSHLLFYRVDWVSDSQITASSLKPSRVFDMAQTNAVQDQPSMEDILTSIRRIIDDGNANTPNTTLPSTEEIANDDSVDAAPLPQSQPIASKSDEASKGHIDEIPELDSFLEALDAKYTAQQQTADATEVSSVKAAPVIDVAAATEAPEIDTESADSSIALIDDAISANNVSERENSKYEARFSDNDRTAFAAVGEVLTANTAVRDNAKVAEKSAPIQSDQPAKALVSEPARARVGGSLNNLSEVLAQEAQRQLPAMTESILKPMLADWLDNNLPSMVERLVREEIERIARGD